MHKRDIVPDLKASGIDSVSVSINTSDPQQYLQLMKSEVRTLVVLINSLDTSASKPMTKATTHTPCLTDLATSYTPQNEHRHYCT